MWELNSNGTLVNSYSGLCATINSVEGKKLESECALLYIDSLVNLEIMIYIMVLTFKLITCSAQANSQGVRSWIATGQKGFSTIPSTLSS